MAEPCRYCTQLEDGTHEDWCPYTHAELARQKFFAANRPSEIKNSPYELAEDDGTFGNVFSSILTGILIGILFYLIYVAIKQAQDNEYLLLNILAAFILVPFIIWVRNR